MQSSAIDTKETLTYAGETEAHGHHPDLRMFGIFMFLIAETMIFFGLFSAYLIYKYTSPGFGEDVELELLLPGINSVVLISSSFIMHKGQTAIKNNDVQGLRLWFGITAALGAIFLVGQAYEYLHLDFGLTSSLFGSCFYVLTGFHGLHVTVGLLLILAVLWRSLSENHYSGASHFGVEAAELYWHFVDVVWVILFILVYLL